MVKNKMSIKSFVFGIVIYCLFSFSSVFLNLASMQSSIINKGFFYCVSIGVLGIFSILWQKLLSKLNLNKAYFFKGTTIIWGLIYGIIIFNEKVTINMLIGALICLFGVLIILGDKSHE